MKKIVTMSKEQAINYTYKKQKEEYIIISINETDGIKPMFNRNNKKLKNILYLHFDDISRELKDHITMSNQDAIDILEFINNHKNIDNIIIHCKAGVSRSVSIRCALEEIYNHRKIGIFPNRDKVYKNKIFSLDDLSQKNDKKIYIFNKLCYKKIKNIKGLIL